MTVSDLHPWRAGSALNDRAVDDGELGLESVELVAFGAAEHVADEERMPGKLGHEADVKAVVRVGSGIHVLHEVVAALHVRDHVVVEAVEGLGFHRRVVVPPDVVLDRGRAHDVLVLGRAASELAGGDQKGPALPKCAFAVVDGLFDQRRFEEVVMHLAQSRDALVFECPLWIDAPFGHRFLPLLANVDPDGRGRLWVSQAI